MTLSQEQHLRANSRACDTHVHVFDPACFSYTPNRAYTPASASVEELEAVMAKLQSSRCVIVQPSVYGSDNACLLSALQQLGAGRARGVAVIDPSTVTNEELTALWDAGIRAVRVNFEAAAQVAHAERVDVIRATAARVRHTGMAIQLYVDTATAAAAIAATEDLGVNLILDHFAGYKCDIPLGSDIFQALLFGLRSGRVWVKLSAPYRCGSTAADFEDLRPAAQAMIAAAPDRMVWATDWPHTVGGAARAVRDISQIEPFRQIDDGADLARLCRWIGDDNTTRKILAENAAKIFDFPEET